MKLVSETLFDLIHSLNKNEKGYFVKWASQFKQSRNADYLVLFKEICESKTYNEPLLKNKMINKRVKTSFSSLKKYLYDQLLFCLTEYHKVNNREIQLYAALSKIEVLYQKGLYKACYRLVCQTEKKNSDLSILFKLRLIKNKLGIPFQTKEFTEQNIGNKVLILEKLIYYSSIINSYLISSRGLRTTKEKKHITLIKKKIRALNIEFIKSDVSLNLEYNKVNFLICFIEERYFFGNKYAQNLKQLLPTLLAKKENEYNPYSIIEIYHYILRSVRRLYAFEDLFLIIEELEKIDTSKIKVSKTKSYLWHIISTFKVDALLFTGNIKSSLLFSTEVVNNFPEDKENEFSYFEFIHISNHLLALFLSNQYKSAAKLASRFLMTNELDRGKTIIFQMWILLIICKLELNEFESAKKHMSKLDKYLHNNSKLFGQNKETRSLIQLINYVIENETIAFEVTNPIVSHSQIILENMLKTHKYEYLWGITIWLKSKIEQTTIKHAIKRLN